MKNMAIVKIRNVAAGSICFLMKFSGRLKNLKAEIFSKKYITPLYFHNPTRKYFEKCMKWMIKEGYNFITLDELIEILWNKKKREEGMAWISFDDGWRGNMKNVIPVLKKYKIPATFFISTNPIENTGAFWWTYTWEYRKYLPESYKKNYRLLWKIEERKRREIVENLYNKIAHKVSREAMTVDDVKYIASLPMIDIGSHTVHHSILTNCSLSQLEYEIGESKKIIEEWIDRPVKALSYPNGDFNGREKKILKKYGYLIGATTQPKLIDANVDPYYVPRISFMNTGFLSEFECRIYGKWAQFIQNIKKYKCY